MMVMLKKGFTTKQYGFVIALHVKIGGCTIKKKMWFYQFYHQMEPNSRATGFSSFHGMVIGLKFHEIYHDILIVWENHQNTSGKSSK